MQALLSCLLFSVLLVQASALKCYICQDQNNCTVETKTCNQSDTWCTAVVFQENSGNSTKQYFKKGCTSFENSNHTSSHPTDKVHLIVSYYYCSTDLCNRENPVIGPEWSETNGLQCYTNICNSQERFCNETNIYIQNCTGPENQCLDHYLRNVSVSTGLDIPESLRKGCGHQPRLALPFGLLTSNSLNLINNCNSSLCNNKTIDFQRRALNGLKCFSCEGRSNDSSSQNQTIIECFGPLSLCIEIKNFSEDERFTNVTKGCATPAYCRQHAKLGRPLGRGSQSSCCWGSLCNGQVANTTVMEEGSATSTTKASIMSTSKSKTYKNGSALVEGNVQFLAALLVISAGWNLIMNLSF